MLKFTLGALIFSFAAFSCVVVGEIILAPKPWSEEKRRRFKIAVIGFWFVAGTAITVWKGETIEQFAKHLGCPLTAPYVELDACRSSVGNEHAFWLTATWFGRSLAVRLEKGPTAEPGVMRVFACGQQKPQPIPLIDTAYGKGPEAHEGNWPFRDSIVAFLTEVYPSSAPSFTIFAPYDLSTLKKLAPPRAMPGVRTCQDVHGLF